MKCWRTSLKNVDPIATKQYIDKANHFLQGMKYLHDDIGEFRTGIGLLAIHSAISLSDAIAVGLTGHQEKHTDHLQAARKLDELCGLNKISDRRGIEHFRWLLGQKSSVAYQDRRFDDNSVRLAVEKAQRFSVWAYEYFREVLRGV